jgi:hypothetical protein
MFIIAQIEKSVVYIIALFWKPQVQKRERYGRYGMLFGLGDTF